MNPTSADDDTRGSRAGDDKSLTSSRFIRGLAATYKEPLRLAKATSVQGIVNMSEIRRTFGVGVASGAPVFPSRLSGPDDTPREDQVLMSVQSDTLGGSEDEQTKFAKAFYGLRANTHMLTINPIWFDPDTTTELPETESPEPPLETLD